MTITQTDPIIRYQGNDSTTEFAVPFAFFENEELKAILSVSGEETVLTEGTDYTLTGAGEAFGGLCQMTVAPATGEMLILYRDPALTQDVSYSPNGTFPAETHEAALDKLTMICQSLSDRLDRSMTFSLSSAVTGVSLPAPEANKVLAWDDEGGTMVNAVDIADLAQAETYAEDAQIARDAAEAAQTAAQTAQAATEAVVPSLAFGGQLIATNETGGTNTRPEDAGGDLNNYLRPGNWEYGSETANAPSEAAGVVEVQHDATAGRVYQRVSEDANQGLFTRYTDDNTASENWTAWKRYAPKNEVHVSMYSDLDAAVVAIGTATTDLVIDEPTALLADLTVPANITLRFIEGAYVSGTATLTLKGNIVAGVQRIFLETLSFSGAPGCQYAYPEWFGAVGDGTTNDHDAVQAWLNFCVATKVTGFIPPRRYNCKMDSLYNEPPLYLNSDGTATGAEFHGVRIIGASREESDIYNTLLKIGDHAGHIEEIDGEDVTVYNLSERWALENFKITGGVLIKNAQRAWSLKNLVIQASSVADTAGLNMQRCLQGSVHGVRVEQGRTDGKDGIYLSNVKKVDFIGCASNNNRIGISMPYSTAPNWSVHFYNQYLEDNEQEALLIRSCHTSTFNFAAVQSDDWDQTYSAVAVGHADDSSWDVYNVAFRGCRISLGDAATLTTGRGLDLVSANDVTVENCLLKNLYEGVVASGDIAYLRTAYLNYLTVTTNITVDAGVRHVATGFSDMDINTESVRFNCEGIPYTDNFGLVIGRGDSPGRFELARDVDASTTVAKFHGNEGYFYVYGDGGIKNLTGVITATSDERLKTNIVDASSQWEDVKALRFVNYNLIDGPQQTMLGLVAQELLETSPGLVRQDAEGYYSVAYSIMHTKAVKALQEAMERIETLESRVSALEAA